MPLLRKLFMARKYTASANFELYTSEQELSSEDAQLMEHARQACSSSYSPYSNFRVGAALRLANGQLVLGSNQENAAYPSGLCAERVAIFSAAAQYPQQPIVSIAIAAFKAENNTFVQVTPCGSCRQVLLEYELRQNSPFSMLLPWEAGAVLKSDSVAQLLPLSFTSKSL